ICEILPTLAARLIVVPVKNDRSGNPDDIAALFRELNPALDCTTAPDFPSALRLARSFPERVLLTGSLFLVGEAIAHLGNLARERSSQ
ncbi:MAG: hypothetical protein V4710_03080, partial [Verrucomicrobiota bacterium]